MTPAWWVTMLRSATVFAAGVGLMTTLLLLYEVRHASRRVPSAGMWWALVTFGYASAYCVLTRWDAFATRLPFSYRDVGTLTLVALVDTTIVLLHRYYRSL